MSEVIKRAKSKAGGLMPVLRFPEFLDVGGWEYLNGNKLFEPVSNKNHNSDLPILAITQEQGAIPREMIDYHVSVSDKSVVSYKVVEVGDFIISLRSFQGGIEYSNYLGICSPAYIILRKKTDILNDFYRHYFKSFQFIQDLNRNLEGIRDGKMISYKQFSDIYIPIPKKHEQQKIASCLSSLDELIAAHSDKLQALKDHKKGLMQNLFPQEGEKVPKYRFPEFENDGEWVEKKLGSLVKIKSGYSPSTYKLNKNGKYPFVKVEDLNNCEKYQIKSREYSDDNANLIPKGSVIFPKRGAAINLNKVRLNQVGILMDTNLMGITPNDQIEIEFLYYIISRNGLSKIADTSTIPQINNKHIQPFEINIPEEKEQKKIASCLSVLDESITAQSKKVEQLQLHKKGLMQGLFPKIDS